MPIPDQRSEQGLRLRVAMHLTQRHQRVFLKCANDVCRRRQELDVARRDDRSSRGACKHDVSGRADYGEVEE